MKGYNKKACWGKKLPNFLIILVIRIIIQLVKFARVTLRYPFILCNKIDHKSMDVLRKYEV
jgi:hypothetical protein